MSPAPTTDEITHALSLPDAEAQAQLRDWAKAGHASAQLVLGQMLLDGRASSNQANEAVNWFLQAAQAGLPMAMNMVGRCYENGWQIEADQPTATGWFRAAAQAGLDWGMYNYATSLALGRGCDKDLGAAFEWLNRAVALGHAKSMNILGGIYEDGWATTKDMARARDLYQAAATAGDFRGWFNLGRLDAQEGRTATALAYMKKAEETATPAFKASMQAFMRDQGLI